MRTRQATVCDTCRNRKLGCDGKLPSCSQCVFSALDCPGYGQKLIFVPDTGGGRGSRKRQTRGPNKQLLLRKGSPVASGSPPLNKRNGRGNLDIAITIAPTLRNELTDIITSNYIPDEEILCIDHSSPGSGAQSRICGAWVEVLPWLSGRRKQGDALQLAIRAMVLSIRNAGFSDDHLRDQYTQTYGSALMSLRACLLNNDYKLYAEFAAASMCLTLSEVMCPTSATGWTTHVKGVGELMRRNGPFAHRTGILHTLFVGFRPLLVIEAVQSCQSTFLSTAEWRSVPFQRNPPSAMQQLLTHASDLSALRERARWLENAQHQISNSASASANELKAHFVDFLTTLDEWKINLKAGNSTPIHWLKDPSSPKWSIVSDLDLPPSLWFPNVSMANAMTHLWALQTICILEIEKLDHDASLRHSTSSSLNFYDTTTGSCCSNANDDPISLATLICQSMEYLVQDKMRLYGPASTPLPLAVALQVFRSAGEDYVDYLEWCIRIGRHVARKGFAVLTYQLESIES